MKNLSLIGMFFLISVNLSGQFRNLTIQKSDAPALKIIQIDFREFSTLIHFQYTNIAPSQSICVSENICVKDKETYKKYKMLSAINLPICVKKHFLDQSIQLHNFTLEFEKIPKSIGEFDIIEKQGTGFNFYGIKIDTTVMTKDFLDITSFIDETPVKESGYYYKDGSPVFYYRHKGLMVAVLLTKDNSYGNYYQVNILIQNFTGKEFHFNPDIITADYFYTVKSGKKKSYKKNRNDDIFFNPETDYEINKRAIVINDSLLKQKAHVLSYNEYMKKVQKIQAWNTFALAFSESLAASNAGYSNSTTQGTAYSYSNSFGSAYGYVGNIYSNIYGSSSSYSSAYSTSSTQKYDGAAAYAAQQNASNNIANYQNNQNQIKKSISDGYMKLNTIMNNTEYVGYVNITFTKADKLQINIPINGTTYVFEW